VSAAAFVLLGAFLGFVFSRVAEYMRAQSACRAAARLITLELARNEAFAATMLTAKNWNSRPELSYWAWNSHAIALASRAKFEIVREVQAAYAMWALLGQDVQAGHPGADAIANAARYSLDAREALKPVCRALDQKLFPWRRPRPGTSSTP